MGQTCFQHGPNMALAWSKKEMPQLWFYGPTRSVLKSLKNVRALAGLKVNIGQTWSQHGPSMTLE